MPPYPFPHNGCTVVRTGCELKGASGPMYIIYGVASLLSSDEHTGLFSLSDGVKAPTQTEGGDR